MARSPCKICGKVSLTRTARKHHNKNHNKKLKKMSVATSQNPHLQGSRESSPGSGSQPSPFLASLSSASSEDKGGGIFVVKKLPLANSLYQQQHALASHEVEDQPTEGVRTVPTPSQPTTPFAGKLLANSLYQQQYSLAGHAAEDQPTEGVRTAPTPSQQPTPFAKGGKLLPGEVRAPLREEGTKVAEQKPKLAAEEDKNEAVKEVEQSEQQEDGETDSLKDLDIVAVSEAQCSDAAAKVDTPDGLDIRAGFPEDILVSPPDTGAGSPDALDGPPDMPDTPPESPDTVSFPQASSSEPGSPQTQVFQDLDNFFPDIEAREGGIIEFKQDVLDKGLFVQGGLFEDARLDDYEPPSLSASAVTDMSPPSALPDRKERDPVQEPSSGGCGASPTSEGALGKHYVDVLLLGGKAAGKSMLGGQLMYLTDTADREMEKFFKVGRGFFEWEGTQVRLQDAKLGGFSKPDVAVLVVSARKGGELILGYERNGEVRKQAAQLCNSGCQQLVVAINKMEDEGWMEERFHHCCRQIGHLLKKKSGLDMDKAIFLPCSAKTGQGVLNPLGMAAEWFTGPPLIPFLVGGERMWQNCTSIEGESKSDKSAAVVQEEEEMGEEMRKVKEVQEDLMEKYKGLKVNATDAKLDEFADLLEKKYEDIKKDTESRVSKEMQNFFEKNHVKIYMKILKAAMSIVKQGREEEKTAATVRTMVAFQKLFFMEQAKDEKTADTLKKCILELGFVDLANKLSMVKKGEVVGRVKKQSFARFQLQHMGGHIDLHTLTPSGFRAEDNSGQCGLSPLHPIVALDQTVLRNTRQLPGDFSMSPSECLELYDALEAALGKKAVAGVEPKKVLGECFMRKSAVVNYNQRLVIFFLEQFGKDENILQVLGEALQTGGQFSRSTIGEDSLPTKCKEEQEETSDQKSCKKEESKQKGGVVNKRQKRPWDGDNVPVKKRKLVMAKSGHGSVTYTITKAANAGSLEGGRTTRPRKSSMKIVENWLQDEMYDDDF